MPTTHPDTNALIAGLLQDMAAIQTSRQKAYAYRRAASVVLQLDAQFTPAASADRIPGLGPSSMRVVGEVLAAGRSDWVEKAVDASGRRTEIERHRQWRTGILSRAEVQRVLATKGARRVSATDCRADFQMHSRWSDGSASIAEMAQGCIERGYRCAAVTDHGHGLPIAGGVPMSDLARQQREIDAVNAVTGSAFRLLKGIEANIAADGSLDLSVDELAAVEFVIAAPHSKLRIETYQTDRMLRVIDTRGVHVLAHPRGRKAGARAGVQANWSRVFRDAAKAKVAIELDGDPSRQDLDYIMAAEALDAGCLFSLGSDAHSVGELRYIDHAVAHARLAGIPPARIINCWPVERLLDWMAARR